MTTWRARFPAICQSSRYTHLLYTTLWPVSSANSNSIKIAALPDVTNSYVYHYLFILQAFSDYQIQQMTANFVDQFGFNDEEFSEHDENIKWVSFLNLCGYFNSVCLSISVLLLLVALSTKEFFLEGEQIEKN